MKDPVKDPVTCTLPRTLVLHLLDMLNARVVEIDRAIAYAEHDGSRPDTAPSYLTEQRKVLVADRDAIADALTIDNLKAARLVGSAVPPNPQTLHLARTGANLIQPEEARGLLPVWCPHAPGRPIDCDICSGRGIWEGVHEVTPAAVAGAMADEDDSDPTEDA